MAKGDDDHASESGGDGEPKPTKPSVKKVKRQLSSEELSSAAIPRTVRQSTKAKTLDSDFMRKRRNAELNDRSKYVRPEKPTFTQEQILEEALHTEVQLWIFNNAQYLFLLFSQNRKKIIVGCSFVNLRCR